MNKTLIISILVVAIIATIVLFVISKNKKKKELELIDKQISEKIGASGEKDVTTILLNVTPAKNYDASSSVEKLIGAKGGWFSLDDDNVVFAVLTGKTKPQLKAISSALQNKTGENLDAYLKDIFGEPADYGKYERALNIIKSA